MGTGILNVGLNFQLFFFSFENPWSRLEPSDFRQNKTLKHHFDFKTRLYTFYIHIPKKSLRRRQNLIKYSSTKIIFVAGLRFNTLRPLRVRGGGPVGGKSKGARTIQFIADLSSRRSNNEIVARRRGCHNTIWGIFLMGNPATGRERTKRGLLMVIRCVVCLY